MSGGRSGAAEYLLSLSGEIPPLEVCERMAGVGLVRSEYIVRQSGHYITTETGRLAVSGYLEHIASLFAPKPVWYRLADFEAREISTLAGADADVHDDNPILGDRGIRRGMSFPDALRTELAAVTKVASEHPNLHLLVSYVGDPAELDFAVEAAADAGFPNQLGTMVEIPAAAARTAQLCERGMTNLTVGLNDLTSLLLGADRPSRFADKAHPVVLETLARVTGVARGLGVPVTVAGDIGPDLVPALIEAGATRLSVHYRDLPAHFPEDFRAIAGLDVVPAIKRATARALRARAARPQAGAHPGYQRHFRGLTEDLCQEVSAFPAAAALPRTDPRLSAVLNGAGALSKALTSTAGAGEASFDEVLAGYDELCAVKAELFDATAEVAATYPSMEAFWADVRAQERGDSVRTYWDSYEHGRRRRLEAVLATAGHSDNALLVNTGMSALDTAIGAACLRPGDVLLAHHHAYFETTEYLDSVLAPRGVRVCRADLSDPATCAEAIAGEPPRVILMEVAYNCPPVQVPVAEELAEASGALFIVDNSMLSHGIRLGGIFPPERLLVVESAIKYLTRRCAAGVVYGTGDLLERVRLHARRTGQQLQERAFNNIQCGELARATERVALHSANARSFLRAVDPAPWAWSHSAESGLGGRSDVLAQRVRAAGPGALLFFQLAGDGADLAGRHRLLVSRWVRACADAGLRIDVRAGFGWDRTTVRAYESTSLNQPEAPAYLRVSIGLEPPDLLAEIAELFNRCARGVTSG